MIKILKQTKNLEERTKEFERVKDALEKAKTTLEERVNELERFYKLTLSRELKMTELKKENKKLKEELKCLEK